MSRETHERPSHVFTEQMVSVKSGRGSPCAGCLANVGEASSRREGPLGAGAPAHRAPPDTVQERARRCEICGMPPPARTCRAGGRNWGMFSKHPCISPGPSSRITFPSCCTARFPGIQREVI
ncbi:unnamed protein product [Rangifer tarandus platyrhynchus]|uniref:Uncharacterized protein n=2 Tax=Rangifer tarandus platyrhynchus TaxID=3082113 RepID=A0ABN8ZF75_RANTA|nr:unnamed protein product [Rangifer tarandus platyrhynchus]